MLRFESKALLPILVMVGLGGCALPGSYTVRECPPNPTAYVFHTGVGETKEAIRRTFPKGFKFVADRTPIMTGDFMPIDASHEMARSFGRAIFAKPENEDDIYLFSFVPLVGKSQVYQSGGEGLDYYATFHLHLTAVDAGRTKVEVFTISPHIPCGRVFNFHAGSGYVNGTAYVKPTTIEEYQILLKIGAALREEGMSPLQIPAATATGSLRIGPS